LLEMDAYAASTLVFDGATVHWQRSGASPEVWCTTMELSTNNGIEWTALGNGTRISDGWQFPETTLPTNGTLRVRGFISGDFKSSGWFQEAMVGAPSISYHPCSVTNNAGSRTLLTVVAGGSAVSYQWLKDDLPLMEGENVAGANTAHLYLSNLLKRDQGEYSVVITNTLGNVTSAVATLTVIEPVITVQPANIDKEAGQSTTLMLWPCSQTAR
jgi:hypothetical protein